jgi:hypothetical protein
MKHPRDFHQNDVLVLAAGANTWIGSIQWPTPGDSPKTISGQHCPGVKATLGLPFDGRPRMSASLTTLDNAANPLDMMEQIVAANEWEFDRRSDSEMAAEAPGQWCDYGLFFNWSHEISVMHFTCAFDLKVPEKQRAALYELLALANEKLWLGHFGLEGEEGMPVFRHAVLLRGTTGASAESLEDLVDIALTECERFFPAFQFVLWAGKSPAEALAAAMLDCVGEA